MTSTTPTAAELHQGLAQAEAELATARQTHASASYELAADRDNPKKRDAVLKAKQRIDLLDAEIVGLRAAAGEASRREEVAEKKGEHDARLAHFTNAEKGIASVRAAFAEAIPLIEKLGALRQQIDAQLETASGQLYSGTFTHETGDRVHYNPPRIHRSVFENHWNGLLQSAQVVPFQVFHLDGASIEHYRTAIDAEVDEVKGVIAAARGRAEKQFQG